MADSDTILTLLGLAGGGAVVARPSILTFVASLFLPNWLIFAIRHGALPAMVAPPVLQPLLSGGSVEPTQLAAGALALFLGYWLRKVVLAIFTGGALFYALPMLLAN